MDNKDEFLYTDIALQMFNTFSHADDNTDVENKEIMTTLFSSLSDEHADNPFFMPALLYAFMVHMNMIFIRLSMDNDLSVTEIKNDYVDYYNTDVRKVVCNFVSNKPSMHQKILQMIETGEDVDSDEDEV